MNAGARISLLVASFYRGHRVPFLQSMNHYAVCSLVESCQILSIFRINSHVSDLTFKFSPHVFDITPLILEATS